MKITINPGGHIFYRNNNYIDDIEFVVLDNDLSECNCYCISANPLKSGAPFDIRNHNEWKISSLRKYLNEEYIKKFNKDDLEPLDDDLITLLSKEDVKEYNDIIPKYSTHWWTRSADASTKYSPWLVDPLGRLHSAWAFYATGIVPACIFNLNNMEFSIEEGNVVLTSKN